MAKSLSPFKKESCCGVILDPRTGNAPGCAVKVVMPHGAVDESAVTNISEERLSS